MTKGEVTIDSGTGAPSGGGAARAVFDALDATIDYQSQTGEALANARQGVADISNAIAELIDYITNNAEVATTVADITSGSEQASGAGTIS